MRPLHRAEWMDGDVFHDHPHQPPLEPTLLTFPPLPQIRRRRDNEAMRRLYLTLAVVSGMLTVFLAGSRCRNSPDETAAKPHRPIEPLPAPRPAGWKDLPADLAKFYSENEGNGLES